MNFWKKKEKLDLTIMVFGIILIGIVISCAVLIILFFTKTKTGAVLKTEMKNLNTYATSSPYIVTKKYQETMTDLLAYIKDTQDTREKILQQTEQTFLTVKVPAEMRDQHLKVFIELLKIKQNTNLDISQLRGELTDLVYNLVK